MKRTPSAYGRAGRLAAVPLTLKLVENYSIERFKTLETSDREVRTSNHTMRDPLLLLTGNIPTVDDPHPPAKSSVPKTP